MKGYIVSFSAILLLSSMLLFAAFYSGNVKDRNISVNEMKKYFKLEFIKDDLAFDLNKMLGTEIEIERTNNLTIVFREKIPAGFNKIARLEKLKDFIESDYSSVNNSDIKFDIRRLYVTRTTTDIPIKFSNGLIYEFHSNNYVLFHAKNKDTNINSIELNLNAEGSSIKVFLPAESLAGDINLKFNYADQNTLNETHSSLQLNSSLDNVILISFSESAGDEIEIHIGSFEGKINAVKIWNKTLNQNQINLVFKAVMDGININSNFNAFIDADLNYFQSDLNSNGLAGLNGFS